MRLIRRYAVAILLAVAALIVAVVMYPRLPARVPVHWSAAGVVDRRMPKSVGAYIQPVSALVVVGLMMIFEPKNWREPEAGAIHWIYPTMVAVLAGFMLYLTILMVLVATGAHPDIPTDVIVGTGILFAAIGSGLGKVPQNPRVGIRVRWTLSNREVWSRTHRLAGWLHRPLLHRFHIPPVQVPCIGQACTRALHPSRWGPSRRSDPHGRTRKHWVRRLRRLKKRHLGMSIDRETSGRKRLATPRQCQANRGERKENKSEQTLKWTHSAPKS
jgi:uncharacterized membrane protein